MNKNDQEFLIQKIRSQYTEKNITELDTLRKLDAQVKRPANLFAYFFGSLGAVIMGSGMSLVMTDLGSTLGISNPLQSGVIIGVIGMLIAMINYPIYKKILVSRKQKFADRIIALSDQIMQ